MRVKAMKHRFRQASLKMFAALVMLMAGVFVSPLTAVAAETPSNVTITSNRSNTDNTNNSNNTGSAGNTGNMPISRSVAPPTVSAEIEGTLLRIDAVSGFFAVEAVFINERRFNFRVDSALVIDISNYIAREETIAVYAVDFAGNRSNTVLLTPPSLDSFLPPPQVLSPLTPDGQATVVDNITDMDGVEFFTFFTPSGNVFYLIVDRQRGAENVYFLNAVTESDLIALAEASGVNMPSYTISGIPAPPPVDAEDTAEEPEPEEPAAEQGGMGAGTIIFLILIFAAVGGAGYYIKILRPRQQQQMTGDEGYEGEEYDEYGDEYAGDGESDGYEDVEENLETEDGYDDYDTDDSDDSGDTDHSR